MDVMKIAKDALLSTEAEKRLESDLVENFTWLKYCLLHHLYQKFALTHICHSDNTFDGFPQDNTGSWLYNAVGMPDYGTGIEYNDTFLHNTAMQGTSDPNQLVFDLMGEGLRFADGPFDTAQFKR